MFIDRTLLRDELAKTIAYYPNSNADYPDLSPSLTTSTYSRYINEVHGLLTLENIDQSKVNFSRFPYPTWLIGTNYTKGDLVNDSNVSYEYISDTPSAGNLTSDTAFWFVLDDVNEYLHQKRFQGVDKAIDHVFNDKKMRAKVKSIYENIALYDGVANYKDTETNQDKFVGLRFRMKSDRDLVTIINKIGHQFTEAVSFNMYLYHSSQQTPIATLPINHTSANSSQWTVQTDLIMRYLDDNYDAGGEFFLGYAQSELGTAQALNMYNIDWFNGFTCSSCNRRSWSYWQNYSPWIDVVGFSINENKFTVGTDFFDPSDAAYTPSRTYGLNLNITSKCDLTPFFLQESPILAEAIQNATGLEIMRDMASNVRGSNNLANQVKQEAEKQVVSFEDVSGTVLDRTMDSFKGLSFDLSGLQSDCLSCDDGNADVIQGTVTLR